MKVNRKKLELAMARACMNSADLPADAIARYLVERCGVDAIFGGEAG